MASIAAGAAARGVWSLIVHPPLDFVYSDMGGYVVGAQHLVSGAPPNRLDAFFPSGTHVVLALPMLVFGTGRTGLWAASVLWWALSALAPWLAWRWTRRILGVPAAAITAVACSLWPLLLTQATFFMSEVPALTLLLAGLLVASRLRDAEGSPRVAELLLLGGVVGLGITVRPQLALNDALAVVPVLWAFRGRRLLVGSLVASMVAPIALVAAINTRSAGHLTLLSENTGVNLFLAHCDGGGVDANGPHTRYWIRTPVYTQTHRGRVYVFDGHDIWDQSFFVHKALQCIRDDGIGHVPLVTRHLLDLTVTSVPWPWYDDHAIRSIVRPTSVAYGLLLPAIIIVGAMTFWGHDPRGRGPRLVLLHLLCLVPTVVAFLSEPRFRVPYDVFGLALVAALVAHYADLGAT